MIKKLTIFLLMTSFSISVFSQPQIGMSGTVEWNSLELNTTVTLDLASAGIRLPAGRTLSESILAEGYSRLILRPILDLQVDSSSTVSDLVERGEFSMQQIIAIAQSARSVPPTLSPDMLNMSSSYTIQLSGLISALMRHSRPSPVFGILNPATTANYTGIIIIASENLPAHGMRRSFLPVPCLFPKIWDSEMNLIYDRQMVEPQRLPVRYLSAENILFNTPSGLSPQLQEVVGEYPLRIFACGVFGINPTDLIIDRNDALLILSGEENRRLLTQGKVAIILNESVLTDNLLW